MASRANWWLAGAVLALLAIGGGATVYKQTRGLRNNNPGNIRRSADRWQGMREQQTDPEFVQFTAATYGIRALAKVLLNYQQLHGLRTVRQIINRWAPPNENNTAAYVSHVAAKLGVSPDQDIAVRLHLKPLVEAIIRHENGIQPYTSATIDAGIRMATA